MTTKNYRAAIAVMRHKAEQLGKPSPKAKARARAALIARDVARITNLYDSGAAVKPARQARGVAR